MVSLLIIPASLLEAVAIDGAEIVLSLGWDNRPVRQLVFAQSDEIVSQRMRCRVARVGSRCSTGGLVQTDACPAEQRIGVAPMLM
jgi:hypothetical protein